jgi:hypothetical protein
LRQKEEAQIAPRDLSHEKMWERDIEEIKKGGVVVRTIRPLWDTG